MKIGFDGKRAVQNFTGLGNYSRYVIEALSYSYPQNEYVLYTPKQTSNKQLDALLERNKCLKIAYPMRKQWKWFASIWRVWNVFKQIEEDKVDVFHGLSNELPLTIRRAKKAKSVVTIHDLIFLLFPQYYHTIDRKIYAYKFRKACENADKIIAISKCTKRDIIRFFGIPEEKIEVVYQGCDSSFQKPVTEMVKEEAIQKYNLPQRFILNVGSIEERKNMLLVVKAMLDVPQDVHLVIVGKRTNYTKRIEQYVAENELTDRVHILNGVPFNLLPAIYQLAEVFVYPSRYEGFGIPVIEALHSGVPVIAATGSCLEEAGGDASIYVHPDDTGGMSDAINYLLTHPVERETMVLRGKEYAKRFSEQKQAESLFSLYQKLIKAD